MTSLLPYKNLFLTRGKYYTFITEAEMNEYIPEGLKYSLQDLKVGNVYTFFRAAIDPNTNQKVFLRLTGKVEIIDLEAYRFCYSHHGEELKAMTLEGYKDHWIFIPGPVSKDSIYVN